MSRRVHRYEPGGCGWSRGAAAAGSAGTIVSFGAAIPTERRIPGGLRWRYVGPRPLLCALCLAVIRRHGYGLPRILTFPHIPIPL